MKQKNFGKRAKLIELIGQGVAEAPQKRGDFIWCAAPQDGWAQELEVSPATGAAARPAMIARRVVLGCIVISFLRQSGGMRCE